MRNEVTRADYARFAAASGREVSTCRNRLSPLRLFDKRNWSDPGYSQTENEPVVCSSFEDARAYAAWLGNRHGQRYRLPTLQEWRHAIQLGSVRNICAQGNVLDNRAGSTGGRYGCNDRHAETAPVRTYAPNGLRLYDMVGNASEWTLACNQNTTASATALNEQACSRRAAAGASWRDGSGVVPATHVQMLDPARGHDDVGFRLLREVDDSGR
jgi:formylglycine-generating enzyme required for sulfatase activity